MLADEHSRPLTPDRVSRSSFSSIREHESTLPQTFSHSKISSYFAVDSSDEALDVDDDIPDSPVSPVSPIAAAPASPTTTTAAAASDDCPADSPPARAANMIQTQTQFQPPVTHPHSKLLGYWTPADSFQGWKGIQVKGKFASKSFGDLQVLHQVFSSPSPRPSKRGHNRPGDAPIERLPTEILSK